MLSQKEKTRLKNYFKKIPRLHISLKIILPIWFLASITFIVLCSISAVTAFPFKYILYPFIALGMFAAFMIIYFIRKMTLIANRATEKEVDIQYLKLVSKDDVVELGRDKFGFGDAQKFIIAPVVFHNYAEKAQSNLSTPFRSKRGKDGLFRSTHIVSLAYFFGENILFQFGLVCDICGDIKYTVCDEIYYRDISKNIQVTSVTMTTRTAKGNVEIVREKIVLYTRSHGIIYIPYWNTDSQKDSFNRMRQYIRALNTRPMPTQQLKEPPRENSKLMPPF